VSAQSLVLTSLSALTILLSSSSATADEITEFDRAQELVRSENWSEAIQILDGLIDTNRWQGGYWHYRGVAHARSGNCESGLSDFQDALSLGSFGTGSWIRHALFEAAACASTTGRVDLALDYLSEANGRYDLNIGARTEDDDRFDAVRHEQEFLWLTGSDTEGLSRNEGWRHDLRWFQDLMIRRHPDPFHTTPEAEWNAFAEELYRNIPTLEDVEVVAGFMRLAAMIQDGHTSVYPPFDGELAFSILPIWPYELEGRWTIVAAEPTYINLVGAELVAIEGVPIDEAMATIASHMTSDHPETIRWLGTIALQLSDVGAAFLGGEHTDRLALTLAHPGSGEFDTTLMGHPIDRDIMSRWIPEGWTSIASEVPPLWLSALDQTFHVAEFTNQDTIYAQINQIRDGERLEFSEFASQLNDRLATTNAQHLILDLRHNNGGNGNLNRDLVHAIIRNESINRPGGLFVITGRRTFSAAQLLINALESQTEALFVGEISSSSPAFFGEDTTVEMPWSGLQASISSRWFQNRFMYDDQRPWIPMDMQADLTKSDLVHGTDPAMSAILNHIESTAMTD